MKSLIILIVAYRHGSCTGDRSNVCGVSNTFSEVVQSAAFVDKTLMVAEFFRHRLVFITAPRRSGKSVNVDMVARFCALEIINGTAVPKHTTDNHRLFATNNLRVYQRKGFFTEHFGAYPIIRLDFTQLTPITSYSLFLNRFNALITNLLNSHRYLLNSHKLTRLQVIDLQNYYKLIDSGKLTETQSITASIYLTEMLCYNFNKKPIVLIDAYDAVMLDAIYKAYSNVGKIIHFLRKFTVSLITSNRFVSRALVYACSTLSRVHSIGANMKHFPFTKKHGFNKYSGFTEPEVIGLAKRLQMHDKITQIRAWYGGYRVNSVLPLYSVFTIISYFRSRKFEKHWAKSVRIENLNKILLNFDIRSRITRLLQHKRIIITAVDRITIKDINSVMEIFKTGRILNDRNTLLILHFLLDMGYFTVIKRWKGKLTIEIPNKEVKLELRKYMDYERYFTNALNISHGDIEEYKDSLLKLGTTRSSYATFARSVSNLFCRAQISNDEEGLHEALGVFPSKEFKHVESDVQVETSKISKTRRPVHGYIHLLVIRNDGTGIILELKYDSGPFRPSEPLELIVNNAYYNVFSKKEYTVENKLFVGVNLKKKNGTEDKLLCCISCLYNSVDIKDNITVIL